VHPTLRRVGVRGSAAGSLRAALARPQSLRRAALLGGGLALIALACTSAPPQREAEWAERGAAAVAPFKRALLSELTQALAAGGPEHALSVCRLRAPALAREASTSARVGRASHRLRNPANQPPAWAVPLLAEYVEGKRREPSVVALRRGRAGYVEPIHTAPLCLTCHGEAVAPALAETLRAQYPDDRATGFRPGELRGVFWAELPAEPPR
jgi:hypothetical protein